MLKVRRAETLGQVTDGEAHLHCHFAFGAYNDPAHMHNGRLRVVNQISLPAQAQYVAGPEKSNLGYARLSYNTVRTLSR